MKLNELVNQFAESKLLDKPTPSAESIAKKHGVSVEYVNTQLKAGIKIESEHTSDLTIAREIASDHLSERPDYYVKLKKVEVDESTNSADFKDMLKVFLPYAKKTIGLDKLPKIILKKTLTHGDQPTMGRFHDKDYRLELAIANRQPVDILRTLAHELVHAKQHSDHIDIDPATGSPEENDANVLAGIIMRNFNKLHPEFLKLKPISEGGNLSLDNPNDAENPYQADEIDLQIHKRSYIIPILDKLLHDINSAFYAQTKKPIWNPQLLQSKEFLGGSSLHFFNTTGISDKEFTKYKPKVGDIDTQCNKELEPEINAFLTSMNHKQIGDATFLGFSAGNEQYNGLFQLQDPPIKIQIDFEFGQYNTETDSPDEWFRFSHSSEWNDIQSGIKGVFHKYIYRALTSAHGSIKHQVDVKKTKTNITPNVDDNDLSFAVASGKGGGLSQKYEPYIHTDPVTGEKKTHDQDVPYKRLIPSGERNYIQKLDQQFYYFFGHQPEGNDSQLQKSFLGTLELMNKYLEPDAMAKVFQSFVDICFEPGAQMITKDDPKRDGEIKFAAIDKFVETCKLQKQRKSAVDKATHYEQDFLDLKSFKEKNPPPPGGKKPMYGKLRKDAIAAGAWKPIAEAIGEAEEDPAVKAQLRKGMPHLKDLKSADFLDLLDELHQGNGQFQLKNIPLNVKVDGFGGRFGKNAEGKPFMGTSRTEPRYKAGFLDYHQKKGTTDPDVLGRAQLFDQLFNEMMKAIQLVDSKLGPKFLINKQVTCEVLYLPFATQTTEGKLKFVGIHYDALPEGVELALVPFHAVEADSGKPIKDPEFINKLLEVGQQDSVMFIDNSLTQNEALDVTAIVPPLENIEQFKAMLTSRKRDQAAEVKAALEPVKLALEKAIINDPNIIGKDLLGKDYEGIVINSRMGPIKVTSQEQKKVISDKNAAVAAGREKTKELSQIDKTPRTAVVATGNFAGHRGHEQLIDFAIKEAKRLGGTPFVFVGKKVGPDDPIDLKTKLETLHKLYPGVDIRLVQNQTDAVTGKETQGSDIKKVEMELVKEPPYYNNILMAVGSDQGKNMTARTEKVTQRFSTFEPLAHVKVGAFVTPRGTDEGGTGVSTTDLRNALKTLPPDQAFKVWAKAYNVKKLGAEWIKHLMDVARKNMNIKEPAPATTAPQQKVAAPIETMAGVGMQDNPERNATAFEAKKTKQRLDPKCWKGYRKAGTQIKGKTRVNKCVKIGESYETYISNLIKMLEAKRPDRPLPKTDLQVGDRVVADLRKEKNYPTDQLYVSGFVTRIGEKGVHIKPDEGGVPEWHPYKIVRKLGK